MSGISNTPQQQPQANLGYSTFDVASVSGGFVEQTVAFDRSEMANAAAALREVEVEAQEPSSDYASVSAEELEAMNIDELRSVAKELGVPDREKIIEKDELITAIRRYL